MAVEYILGVDYGNKRVGVAVAHVVARLPRPLTTLANDDQLVPSLQQLVQAERVGLVVVGLPRSMDGSYSQQTHAAEAFKNKLAEALNIPVATADETLTSVDAEASLTGSKHAKGDVDALAASLILERYLAEHSTEEIGL